ncbi:MAG TPA: tetratricopeptide repeat protein [Bacteroidia bacterium]|nr:tetratricopeptide repeat protein [Bacteroidia bacterium]
MKTGCKVTQTPFNGAIIISMSVIKLTIPQIQFNPDKLHEAIIAFWDVASNGDLNELKKQSVIVKELCSIYSLSPHAEDYIRLVCAIEGFFESNCAEAEINFLAVLPPNVLWENKEIEAMARLFCGGNYRSLGQYDKALFHLLEVPRLINPLGSYATYALLAYYFLGELHVTLGEFKSAESYYKQGLNFGKENIIHSAKFRLYSGLGNLYLNNKDYARSEEHFIAAIEAARPGSQLARSWYDMAVYYELVGEIDKAIEYCRKSYELRIESNLLDAATTSYILMGSLNIKKGDLNHAIFIFKEALVSTLKYNAIVKTQSIYKYLAECYEKLNDWKQSLDYFKRYEEIKSNMFSEQQTKFFKIKNEEISKQKELIEEFHGELKDSIKYALRIQQAILPPAKLLTQVLPESFLFYKPKDVVSGDFYWLETVTPKGRKAEKLILFAVADCTGHGVPGAMVSIVCVNALNRSVREFLLTEPAQILNKTRELVIEAFEKSEQEVKDGMDISLCSFNPQTHELQWAGANNPLYILPHRANERFKASSKVVFFPEKLAVKPQLVEFKPNKQPIGIHSERTAYTNHIIQLHKGDIICIFSDGFPDQFGGPNGKKYKYKAFKENLIRIMNDLPSVQMQVLDTEFTKWKGNYEQVDDVCVMGVRV